MIQGLSPKISVNTWAFDIPAGITVFLVATPLCMGIALACGTSVISGLWSGIVGGIVVGSLSGSHTSVSGPSPALTAMVPFFLSNLGSFEALLLAIFIAGLLQVLAGFFRLGFLAQYFPHSVIQGLLAAIGAILILKQLPHLVGLDVDFEGDMTFWQADHENTFSELLNMFGHFHGGCLAIGLMSLALLVIWNRSARLNNLPIPAPLVVLAIAASASVLLSDFLLITEVHRVNMPQGTNLFSLAGLIRIADFSSINLNIVVAGCSIALFSCTETLLNIRAVDKIDPLKRTSPADRELCAQGVGNMILGLIGGLPVSSAVARSFVNINAGAKSKNATIIHGVLLLVSVVFMGNVLNFIPLSALAAILIVIGMKLIKPHEIKSMWQQGLDQFLPFMITFLAILFSDLLWGIGIGLLSSIFFILKHNVKSQTRIVVEKHLGHTLHRIVLANQVSFLNKAALTQCLEGLEDHTHVVIDASDTDYIDQDVLETIREFELDKAPMRHIQLSLVGFKPSYELLDTINYVDYATFDLQQKATPKQVLKLLQEGNSRVREGRRIKRDLNRQIEATSEGQYPVAVILSCIDSRVPVELVFDLGIGDVFSVRMAGNVVSEKVLGSIEFACAVAGAKMIVVMGHTKCGAVSAALEAHQGTLANNVSDLPHLGLILDDIQKVASRVKQGPKDAMLSAMITANIHHSMAAIRSQSPVLHRMLAEGKIGMVGCLYDVVSGSADFIEDVRCAKKALVIA